MIAKDQVTRPGSGEVINSPKAVRALVVGLNTLVAISMVLLACERTGDSGRDAERRKGMVLEASICEYTLRRDESHGVCWADVYNDDRTYFAVPCSVVEQCLKEELSVGGTGVTATP